MSHLLVVHILNFQLNYNIIKKESLIYRMKIINASDGVISDI